MLDSIKIKLQYWLPKLALTRGGLGRRQTGRLADPAGGQGLCPLLPRRHAGSAKSDWRLTPPSTISSCARCATARARSSPTPTGWRCLPMAPSASSARSATINLPRPKATTTARKRCCRQLPAGRAIPQRPVRHHLSGAARLPPRAHAVRRRAARDDLCAGRSVLGQPAHRRQRANLFARNERVICVFDTDIGPMVQIWSAPPSSAASRPSGPAPSRRRASIIKRWTYPAAGEEGAIALEKAPRWAASNSAPR